MKRLDLNDGDYTSFVNRIAESGIGFNLLNQSYGSYYRTGSHALTFPRTKAAIRMAISQLRVV